MKTVLTGNESIPIRQILLRAFARCMLTRMRSGLATNVFHDCLGHLLVGYCSRNDEQHDSNRAKVGVPFLTAMPGEYSTCTELQLAGKFTSAQVLEVYGNCSQGTLLHYMASVSKP